MEQSAKHILLSSMGTGTPRETLYAIDDRTQVSLFSAFGLLHLLPDECRPDEIWFLLTPEAKVDVADAIESEAERSGIEVRIIDILGNDAENDSGQFLETVGEAIPAGCQLTLDVTRGLRHHAFLLYALALYLGEFRNIDISGAWYCRWEIPGNEKPFIDLKPVLDLGHWFHALGVFRETGSLRALSKLTNERGIESSLDAYSSFFLTGMPIEAAAQAADVLSHLQSESPSLSNMPLAKEIENRISEELNPLAGPEVSQDKKKEISLDQDQLDRQAIYIDRYLETGQLNLAFGLMREWVVTRILLGSDAEANWLKHRSGRQPVERQLGGLSAIQKNKNDPARDTLSEEQIKLAKLWDDLCQVRNALQHHGMRPEAFQPDNKTTRRLKTDWTELKTTWSPPASIGGGKGRLLICPIGMSPGVLYAALKKTTPDRVIVICSEKSKPNIDEAIKRAESQAKTLTLLLQDSHTGIDEFKGLVSEASLWLFEADEIFANLTGGTSLMGVLVNRLVQGAGREYQRPVQEFVLIDKRSPEEQRNDPWQLGVALYLDGEPVNDGADRQDGADTSEETEQ